MNWISSGEHLIDFGVNAKALEKLMNMVNEILGNESAPLDEVLEIIISGSGLDLSKPSDRIVRELAKRLSDGDINSSIGGLPRLRKRLWKIEEGNGAERTFSWPIVKSKLAKNLSSFNFVLNAEGGVSFQVQQGSPDDDSSKTKLSLLGKVDPKFSTSIAIPKGAFELGGNAQYERSLIYLCAYDDDVRTGRALVDSFSRLSFDLSDFHSVLSSFNQPAPYPPEDDDGIVPLPVEEIIFSGRQSIGANVAGSVKFPIKALTVDAGLRTAVEIGGDFTIKIRRKDKQTLQLEAVGGQGNDRVLELGLGASVGLSAISPKFAITALSEVKNVQGLFDKIDDVFDSVDTWLKPGSAIKSELERIIGDEISGSGANAKKFKRFLNDVFGVGPENDVSELINAGAGQVADLIDDSRTLFTTDDEEEGAFAEILSDLTNSLIAQVADDPRSIEAKFKKVLNGAKSKLSDKLNESVNRVDESAEKILIDLLGYEPSDVLASLREVISSARSIVDEIAQALSENSLDALGVEIGWARNVENRKDFSLLADISVEGSDFYSKAIKKTSAAINSVIDSGNAVPGVRVDPEESWIAEKFAHENSTRWNISILGTSADSTRSKLHKLEIKKSLGGVGIVAKGGASVDNSFFFSKEVKRFSFANVLTFGPVGDSSPGIGLELTHDDNNLKVGEAEDVLSVFLEAGLISSDTFDRAREVIRDARIRLNGEKLPAELSVSFGLPGGHVLDLINYAIENSFETKRSAAHALVSMERSRSKVSEHLERLFSLGLKRLPRVLGLEANNSRDGFKFDGNYVEVVMQADAVFEYISREFRGLRSSKAFPGTFDPTEIKSFWKKLVDARDGLHRSFLAMSKAQEVMQEFAKIDSPNEEQQKRLWKELKHHQRRIVKNIKPWLRPGMGGIWDRPPERAAELFIALQELSEKAIGGRPPLIVSFNPDHGAKKLFIGNAA